MSLRWISQCAVERYRRPKSNCYGAGAAVSMAAFRLIAWQAMASGQAVGWTTAFVLLVEPNHCAASVGDVATMSVVISANMKRPPTMISSRERDVDTES